jgi:16S rRNA (adenine1518-N6/adenine1519-N6)-dimethyltransferase
LVGPGASYKVVANLPYYITSAALRHFLDAPLRPRLMVVMVQEEVGRRIVAKPPRLSLLAVSVQYYGVPRLVDIVPASAFYPQPHVRSAILRIDVYEQPPYDVPSADILFATVAAGFSQPRKQVHNSLAHALSLDAAIVAEALTAAGVSGDRRPSTLSLDEWAAVTRALAPFLVGHPDVLRRQRKRGTQ